MFVFVEQQNIFRKQIANIKNSVKIHQIQIKGMHLASIYLKIVDEGRSRTCARPQNIQRWSPRWSQSSGWALRPCPRRSSGGRLGTLSGAASDGCSLWTSYDCLHLVVYSPCRCNRFSVSCTYVLQCTGLYKLRRLAGALD